MASKEKLKDIWAMTDKPQINVMKKRSPQSLAALNNNSSSDTTSESASDTDSDFSALPEEFRPNLNIETICPKNEGNHQISPSKPLRKSVPSSTSRNKNASENTTLGNEPVSRRTENCNFKEKINQNNFDVNLNTSRKMDKLEKKDEPMDRSNINTSLNKSKKKTIQYEYVQKQNVLQEPKLIRMKIDMSCKTDTLSTQEKELKYETRLAPNASVRSKKLPDVDNRITKQKFRKKRGYNSKGDSPSSIKTSNIKWDDSLSLKPEQNNRIRWNYVQIEKRVSVETFTDNPRKFKKEYTTREKSGSQSENFGKFNDFGLNEIRKDHSSKYSPTQYPTAKNAKPRTKDYKNCNEFFFKENNLHSENESKIKFKVVKKQDFKGKELQDEDSTYVKDYINNCRKQNTEDILRRSSLAETINLPCACSQKPRNNFVHNGNFSHIENRNAANKSSQSIEEQRNCRKPEDICCSLNKVMNLQHTGSQKSTNNFVHNEDSSCIQNRNTATKSIQNIEEQRNNRKQNIEEICQSLLNVTINSSQMPANSFVLSEDASPIQDRNAAKSLPRACSQMPSNNFVLSEDASPIQDRNAAAKSLQNIEEQRNCILHYGKEMSDLIIGSYTALSMLVSFYREWTVARRELIVIFQQLEKNLQESSKTLSRYADVLKVAKSGSDLATNIPHPAVIMTAKIVSIITGLLQTILKSKEDKLEIDDSDMVTRAMIRDTQSTSELHIYVLQCSQQFEETTKFIKEFHSESKIQKYLDNENPEITTFIKGFLEYKPDHRIFYKKLHKCLCELLQTSSTSFSKSFCEPFTFYSSATEVIEYLNFSFRFEDFDSTSVNHELEAISRMIGNENNTTIADLHKRIRTCIMILTEELDFRERCMKDISLFDTSTFSKKLF